MKKGILFLLLAASGAAQGQSLKEALYSGKLKNQPGTVIRKGDDLSTKMDTAAKAPVADSLTAAKPANTDSAKTALAATNTTVLATSTQANTATAATSDTTTSATVEAEAAPVAAPAPAAPKDNNAIWRDYMKGVAASLQGEALSSKKIKKGTYFATVSYTIETTGQVTVTDVLLSPENDGLKKQITERITADAPQLNPVVNSSGTARKVNKKYNFSLVKE